MLKYGAYQPDPLNGDITWFRTSQALDAGAYVHGHGSTPNVYIEDSVAALIMRISPNINAAEHAGQEELAPADMDAAARDGMAAKLTDELMLRLSRDDSIWVDEPRWLHRLRPAG